MRRLVRLGMLVVLIGSLAATGVSTLRVLSDPTLTAIRTAAADEIIAATDAVLATDATPERLAALIETRLQETPRNWLALDALTDLVAERGIALPVSLLRRLSEARADDFSLLSQASACALCAYDPAQCSLSQVMMCQAPVALTPVGDIAGVTRAGVAYVSGDPIDQIDLALSVVGLGATAAVLASGGTSVVVKAGQALPNWRGGWGGCRQSWPIWRLRRRKRGSIGPPCLRRALSMIYPPPSAPMPSPR